MGRRGPKPIGEEAIGAKDYFRPVIGPLVNKEERQAKEWFDSFTARERAELLVTLHDLWQEEQIVALDRMAGN